jgi:hypothetical protein
MLDGSAVLRVHEVDVSQVKRLLEHHKWESCVGHQSTAEILTALLGRDVPMNRVAVKLHKGDTAIVFQVMVRVEEGKVLSKEEIEKLPTKFFVVEVVE